MGDLDEWHNYNKTHEEKLSFMDFLIMKSIEETGTDQRIKEYTVKLSRQQWKEMV